jgi:protein ATS1
LKEFPSENEDDDEDAFIVDISASMSHTVVVLSNGSVYGWGAGRKGQLGELVEDTWSPRKITGLPFEPYRVACGRDFTLFAGDPDENQFHILGTNNRHGVLSIPSVPPNIPYKSIGASWSSAYVLLTNGDLISWGRNDHGQLGPEETSLPKLAKIAVGSEHAVALTTDGQVVTWGWGEHGNCGAEVDEDGDVKGKDGRRGYNEIALPPGAGRVIGVGAGCATTFIITAEDAT